MEEKIETAELVEQPKEKKNLVFAAYVSNTREISPVWNNYGGMSPDKMKVSDNYNDQLELCKFFTNRDTIVIGVINKQVELAFNGYKPRRNNCTDEEFEVYCAVSDKILSALKVMAREYLISGLLVPEITWKSVKGKELNLKGRPNKSFNLPDEIWLRDPSTIELKRTPIPNKVRVYFKVPTEDVNFITSKGVYSDGTRDVELYQQMLKDYPEYVKKIKSGDTSILLENAFILRRNPSSGNIYPTPYLLPALESLQHKRNLKKMDYSIASRVISAIQKITLGSDKFPLTEDDQEVIDKLKEQMLWRGQEGNIERVFQLFGNHTLNIEWIYPNTEALLDAGKYSAVNNDILHALGMPAIITTGETTRSATSQAEFALLPPTEVLKSLRKDLEPFLDYLYQEIQKANNFSHRPVPAFPPIRLYDPAKAAQVGEKYYQNGVLSKTTWGDLGDFDFENEQILRKFEDEFTNSMGLTSGPQVPYSSPQINAVKPENTQTIPE